MVASALLAAALGVAIGAVIGGLGGGGGVLAVPALVYLLHQDAQDATTSSVVIVGITALVGVLSRIRARLVDWRTGAVFAVIGIPVTFLGTALNHAVSQPVLLLSFAAVTLLAAIAMIVDVRAPTDPDPPAGAEGTRPLATVHPPTQRLAGVAVKTVLGAAAVGFLTGFLGVGGGFLVVPVLVVGLRMPMKLAVGTSLLVITLNAIASFAARVPQMDLDWTVVAPFTAAAVIGSLVGRTVAGRLSGTTLTRAFAVLLVVVGVVVGIESVLDLL
ncbi:sulfite exporter TauE/SafE family protein [Pseudonocardia thermophila]|jgi:Predicted permeases|uniref:sulfite exporter TauE/SafE family protein n=1 Tax=Pseudonocardia thermophila TaxID=1848 RepID=UPI00248DF75A|nr:sulfite exporter TauE/SafE family protein [Pseudonocardia thermophila]